jgi:hypothetical protein
MAALLMSMKLLPVPISANKAASWMFPKALQIRRLMHKWLVFERIPFQKIIHLFLPFFDKGY